MRIGVFGGTFDPVHVGHLILAERCRESARLDQVLFVPSAVPPHKKTHVLTPFAQRVEMLTLAISGHPPFRIDELENERSGPSYTVDTLTQLQAQRPGDEFCFILGSDSLHDFPTWRQPARILELATLLVIVRSDWPAFAVDELRKAVKLPDDFRLRYEVVEAPLIDISSREIRQRIAASQSVRYMIPRAVEAYIEDKGLYKAKI